jgi:predicted nucleic acid-binding protein
MMLVLDASMALAWIFARPAPSEQDCADRALQSLHGAVARVPVIWQLEAVNALLVGERRHVVTAAQSSDYLRRLDQLVILTDFAEGAAHRDTVLRIARQYDLSAYDASYLELALRLSAPLATFDRQLARAAQAAGGAVFA